MRNILTPTVQIYSNFNSYTIPGPTVVSKTQPISHGDLSNYGYSSLAMVLAAATMVAVILPVPPSRHLPDSRPHRRLLNPRSLLVK
jgi:hypothetical protein